jgi:hypothetical protein
VAVVDQKVAAECDGAEIIHAARAVCDISQDQAVLHAGKTVCRTNTRKPSIVDHGIIGGLNGPIRDSFPCRRRSTLQCDTRLSIHPRDASYYHLSIHPRDASWEHLSIHPKDASWYHLSRMSAMTHEYMSKPSGNWTATRRAASCCMRHTVLWICERHGRYQ